MDNIITIEPATPSRWADVQLSLTGGGDGRSCQCTWWTLANAQYSKTTADERRDVLHDEIRTGPPPGLIAYVDGDAAGWVRVGPRTRQARISRTRNIVAATSEPLDDDTVWAVTCFSIRREHRGKGLSSALLEAAVAYAKDGGARVIEAYPIDTGTGKHRSNELFLGTLATFRAAGFRATGTRKPGNPLVTLEVA